MMHDGTANNILTLDQIERAVREVIAASGPEGTGDDRIFSAVDDLRRFALEAGLFRAWESGATVLGWDDDQQTLRFWSRGMQPFPLPEEDQ